MIFVIRLAHDFNKLLVRAKHGGFRKCVCAGYHVPVTESAEDSESIHRIPVYEFPAACVGVG